MNQLRLIIDRQKRSNDLNCAIDADLDALSTAIIRAVHRYVQGYQDGLSREHADFIMRNLLRILNGQPVRATVTDHTRRKTFVTPF